MKQLKTVARLRPQSDSQLKGQGSQCEDDSAQGSVITADMMETAYSPSIKQQTTSYQTPFRATELYHADGSGKSCRGCKADCISSSDVLIN